MQVAKEIGEKMKKRKREIVSINEEKMKWNKGEIKVLVVAYGQIERNTLLDRKEGTENA